MEINIGYAWGQLARARQTAAEHVNADVRARARETIAKWEGVIAGMQAGTIAIGSRAPTAAPVWVTLDVVTGGFATGGYSAGGMLRDWERSLAARLGVEVTRRALNLHYLTTTDASELLASGHYQIDLPEAGALLVVAWLRDAGQIDRANALVDQLAPWLETLRFYPVPNDAALELTDTVRLQELSVTLHSFDVDRRQPRFEVMRDAVLRWKPLYERALALLGQVVDPTGARVASLPASWHAEVAALVAESERPGVPPTKRANATLEWIARLARCANAPASVAPAEWLHIRRRIDQYIAVHGEPGSRSREAEVAAVAAPLHANLRRVAVARLRALRSNDPVQIERALAPVDETEARQFDVPAGTAMPAYFEPKLARSCDAPLEQLVERGVIASAEVLARVLPQVTSRVRARMLADPAAQKLYVALYQAFRRRRGLLLVNYQHQVRFAELPWVAALESARAVDTQPARRTVAGASRVALRAFPYTIVPNKLVTELYALAEAADLQLPLVEELAADIFMGSFTQKFVAAAKVSARMLAGTLYQRYYAIDVGEIERMSLPAGTTSAEFAALCARRAAPTEGKSRVAGNGKIIEQAQILTTHNLAVLFDALDLRDALAPDMRPIAETCFQWATRRLMLRTTSWHQLLINLKNAAYAWRQMMFYASFVPDPPAFASWARTKLERVEPAFRQRFEPAMRGLELAATGSSSSAPTFVAQGGRVFTGWTTDRHWLAPARVLDGAAPEA